MGSLLIKVQLHRFILQIAGTIRLQTQVRHVVALRMQPLIEMGQQFPEPRVAFGVVLLVIGKLVAQQDNVVHGIKVSLRTLPFLRLERHAQIFHPVARLDVAPLHRHVVVGLWGIAQRESLVVEVRLQILRNAFPEAEPGHACG